MINSNSKNLTIASTNLMLLAIIIGVVTLACSDQEYVEQRVDVMSDHLFYYHDTRTNLCYAALSNSLANVECNKEVLDSAIKFESKKPSWK